MIEGLRPYPAYKDSGVPWIGRVPVGWEVAPLRYRFEQCLGKMLNSNSIRGDAPVPYLRNVDVQWDRINTRNLPQMDIAPSEYERYTVRPGDLLVCEGGEVGRAAIWKSDVSTCGFQKALHRLRPWDPNREDPRFMLYQLVTAAQADAFHDGHVSTIPHLTGDKLRAHRFVFPRTDEQKAIVRFLDHADRLIQRYIREKRKLIVLLNEQKQAIIHRAVTRGLDPSARMKDSGVPWIGEVPAHWEVLQLRRVSTSFCDGPFGSGLKSSHYVDHGVRVVRLTNIGHAEYRMSDAAFIDAAYYATLGDHSVVPDDLLIAGLGDERHPSGRACVAPQDIGSAMVKADCFRFRLDTKRLLPRFAAYHLTATAVTAAAVLSTGATRQRTNLGSTANRSLAVPPRHEQDAITHFLDGAIAKIARPILATEREITLLREYRARLIADVVTGQLDVREAAARLPELPSDDAPSDTDDLDSDTDDPDTDAGDDAAG